MVAVVFPGRVYQKFLCRHSFRALFHRERGAITPPPSCTPQEITRAVPAGMFPFLYNDTIAVRLYLVLEFLQNPFPGLAQRECTMPSVKSSTTGKGINFLSNKAKIHSALFRCDPSTRPGITYPLSEYAAQCLISKRIVP